MQKSKVLSQNWSSASVSPRRMLEGSWSLAIMSDLQIA